MVEENADPQNEVLMRVFTKPKTHALSPNHLPLSPSIYGVSFAPATCLLPHERTEATFPTHHAFAHMKV
jgi:hypothetical protein